MPETHTVETNRKKVAIIGGGLTGLTAAIRSAERGFQVDLYEASPQLGGRTRSFFHPPTQRWVDHGPHLLIGVYQRTQALLQEIDALQHTAWQSSLRLPLWERERQHFALETSPYLPFSLALIMAVYRMSGHGFTSIPSLLRMALSMRKEQSGSVADWMLRADICPNLQKDMIELLCLGAMNEAMTTADAASFAHVLQQAFSCHRHARLGWFTKPLTQALIEPLQHHAEDMGVKIHTTCRVRHLASDAKGCCTLTTRTTTELYDGVILATPPSVRDQLLPNATASQSPIETRPITNIHLWFKQKFQLPEPFIGGLGTYGQWFFDVSAQHQERDGDTHICAVISADDSILNNDAKLQTVLLELETLTGMVNLSPTFHRVVTVQAATHLVRHHPTPQLPPNIIDACEQPQSGELPATIETAVVRGESAAQALLDSLPYSRSSIKNPSSPSSPPSAFIGGCIGG